MATLLEYHPWEEECDAECVDSDGTEHVCSLPKDHSDSEYDGYHQCECGITF